MASVQSYRGDHYCTSEVLSPTWVLTAGHCLPPYSGDRVKAGTHDLSQPGQVRTIKRALRHELYNDWSEGSDLALLELDAPLVGITPVKLSSERPIIGAVAIAAGWGRTCSTCPTSTKLLLAETKLISNLECSLSYPGSIQVSMVCGTAPGRDAAPGDSGGFFGQILAGELQQVGVVSWGRACEAADPGEDPTQPCVGVYARLEGTVGGIEACIK
jgi:secreted trypsin-like serine protease